MTKRQIEIDDLHGQIKYNTFKIKELNFEKENLQKDLISKEEEITKLKLVLRNIKNTIQIIDI